MDLNSSKSRLIQKTNALHCVFQLLYTGFQQGKIYIRESGIWLHSAIKSSKFKLGEALGPTFHVASKFTCLFDISHYVGCHLPFCKNKEANYREVHLENSLGILLSVMWVTHYTFGYSCASQAFRWLQPKMASWLQSRSESETELPS